jgi:Domain of unknown function (DUF3067)
MTLFMLGLIIALGAVSLAPSVACFTVQKISYERRFHSSHFSSADGDSENTDFELDDLSLDAFQKAKAIVAKEEHGNDKDFDGYDFRDIIYAKWGQCFDVDFNPVDSFGFKSIYLNIYPFHLGRKPFRHETEYDYLCHLQAVVEILQEYGQLEYVLYQIGETKKRPIPGRAPIVAVPCRLDLSEEQVNSILGGRT